MIIPIILLGFAVFVVVLGRPVADVESLYYDAEFEEVSSDEESCATEESCADVGANAEAEDVDIEKLARSIYDGVDL